MLFEYVLVIWIVLSGVLILLLMADAVLADENRYFAGAAQTLQAGGKKMLEGRPRTLGRVIITFAVFWLLALLAGLGVWAWSGISI